MRKFSNAVYLNSSSDAVSLNAPVVLPERKVESDSNSLSPSVADVGPLGETEQVLGVDVRRFGGLFGDRLAGVGGAADGAGHQRSDRQRDRECRTGAGPPTAGASRPIG